MSKVKFKKEVFDKIAKLSREGLTKAGEVVQFNAKMLCPVDTGDLVASIKIDKNSGNTVVIGAHTHYAFFVEMGTRKMLPRAYLRAALDVEEIKKAISDTVMAGL